MGLDAATVEGMAVEFYQRLRLDPAVPVDTLRQARMFLGRDAIERGVGIVGERAKTFVVRGQRRIAINRKLAIDYAQHAVGHELGHAILDEMDYVGEDTERVCDLLGAALMAPLPAVRAMLRAFGRDHAAIADIADEVVATHTWAALRTAEALGIPRAILTPQKIYVRGPEAFVWGDEVTLRRIARASKVGPGIARTKLRDDPRRIVVDIDESVAA